MPQHPRAWLEAVSLPAAVVRQDTRPQWKQGKSSLSGEQGACFSACMYPLNQVAFADVEAGPIWAGRIKSDAYTTSIAACMGVYCTDDEIAAGWERFDGFRHFGANDTELPPFETVLSRIEDISAVPVVDVMSPPGMTYNDTILITKQNYDDGLHTELAFGKTSWFHDAFGATMFALLALMVFIGIANRVLAYLGQSSKSTLAKNAEGDSLATISPGAIWPRAYTWYERHIGTPALFGRHHVQPWGILSIPTRLQGIIIFVYVALNVWFGLIKYDVFYNNFIWYGRRDLQLSRYVADRTGVMSFYNMVLLWLLAGRNDFLIWLTGWSFQSLNIFHRWTARVTTVQALIHTACFVWVKWGYFWDMMHKDYWHAGVHAMAAMFLLLPLSILPIRQKFYEAFLLIHIFLSVIVLFMLWAHVHLIRRQYLPFVQACIVIWAFDRILRLVRVIALSYKTMGSTNTVASIKASDPGLIRVSVRSSIPLQPRPGDYYFLYSPRSLAPWENHPFSLASWEQHAGGTTLHFLISPFNGWTGRLRRRIQRVNGGAKMRILLEGPYGHGNEGVVESFDHILLVAGGSGIAAMLPYMFYLSRSERKHRITVIWTVRNAEYAADVLRNELAEDKVGHVDLHIFLTKQDPAAARQLLQAVGKADPDAALTSTEDTPLLATAEAQPRYMALDGENATSVGPTLVSGRPDMRDVLRAELDNLTGGERLAVLACGPGTMMDDIRQATAEAYGTGMGKIDASRLQYFEEAHTW